MNKDFIFQLVKSTLLTIIVAGTVSLFLSSITNLSFLLLFFLLIVVQFIFFYFYGEHIKSKNNKLQLEAEIKIAEKLAQQETTVVCPCDRNIQATIPINLNGPNSYICRGCDKEISVFVETKTALTTTPVTKNPLTELYFVEDIKKLISNDSGR